jgi:hypothetical protein
MTTNVQHQIQADRSGKIWINVNSNDPRLNINGIVARIRPVYNHRFIASIENGQIEIIENGCSCGDKEHPCVIHPDMGVA